MKKYRMKKYVILLSLISLLFNACKEKPKCCCIILDVNIGIGLTDSSKSNKIDTNFLKRNNTIYNFTNYDSVFLFTINASLDSAKTGEIINTTSYLKISSTDTDTIVTEIDGTICGFRCNKVWYNGVLKYTGAFTTTGRTISISK
jgi:hypothetical protein